MRKFTIKKEKYKDIDYSSGFRYTLTVYLSKIKYKQLCFDNGNCRRAFIKNLKEDNNYKLLLLKDTEEFEDYIKENYEENYDDYIVEEKDEIY